MKVSRRMAVGIVVLVLIAVSTGYVALNPSVLVKGFYLAQGLRAGMPALFVTGDYTVENFEPSYRVVNTTGYTVYIEENRSRVSSNSNVLEVEIIYEDKYHELSGVMGQFGNPNLDGGPNQDWTPSLDPRTRNAIEEYDYIKYDGYYYNLSYKGPEEIPGNEVSFDAKLLDDRVTPGDPAKMQLKLKINSENNISISSGAPYPFTTLYASSPDNRLCIWSQEYKKSEHVHRACEQGGLVHAIGIVGQHQPGETIKRNYTIRAQDVQETGSYVIEESVDYTTKEGSKTLEYSIRFDLSKLSG